MRRPFASDGVERRPKYGILFMKLVRFLCFERAKSDCFTLNSTSALHLIAFCIRYACPSWAVPLTPLVVRDQKSAFHQFRIMKMTCMHCWLSDSLNMLRKSLLFLYRFFESPLQMGAQPVARFCQALRLHLHHDAAELTVLNDLLFQSVIANAAGC